MRPAGRCTCPAGRGILFDANGLGIAANDEGSATFPPDPLSYLPPGTVTDGGLYYLAISTFVDLPINGAGPLGIDGEHIFDPLELFFSPGEAVGPDPAVADPTVRGWDFDLVSFDTGSYQIVLTGAKFAAIPELSSWLVWLVIGMSATMVNLCTAHRSRFQRKRKRRSAAHHGALRSWNCAYTSNAA